MSNQPNDPIRDGNVWLFPDGHTLPVISGGSDEGFAAAPAEAAPAAEAPAAAPSSAPDPSVAEPTPPSGSVTDDPFDGDLADDQQVFSRGYVEKLRKQGQTYREQAQTTAEELAQYNEVYGQYDSSDRETWFELASQWATNPRDAAEWMQRIASAVLNDGLTPEQATDQVIAEDQITDAAEQQGIALTPAQIQAMVDERFAAQQAEQAQQQAIDDVFAEVRAGGFDPQSRDGHSVLWTANNETNGDIAKAIEIVKADRQRIIDEYVQGKSAPSARPAPSDGVLALDVPQVSSLDDAFKSANEFLKGMQSQPG